MITCKIEHFMHMGSAVEYMSSSSQSVLSESSPCIHYLPEVNQLVLGEDGRLALGLAPSLALPLLLPLLDYHVLVVPAVVFHQPDVGVGCLDDGTEGGVCLSHLHNRKLGLLHT